jgi:hypothetical protein
MAETPRPTPSAAQPDEFRVRIVALDYYMAPPAPLVDLSYSSLEGTAIDRVPVVRIFGSTPAGQKACLHLHKVGSRGAAAAGPAALQRCRPARRRQAARQPEQLGAAGGAQPLKQGACRPRAGVPLLLRPLR